MEYNWVYIFIVAFNERHVLHINYLRSQLIGNNSFLSISSGFDDIFGLFGPPNFHPKSTINRKAETADSSEESDSSNSGLGELMHFECV